MLTKQERAAITERLRDCPEADYYSFYEAMTGAETTKNTPLDEDIDKISDIILDLCDVSSMVELPLDKNDEIIHIGDVMYDGFNRTVVVSSIEYKENERNVFVKAHDHKADVTITYLPKRLIHKNIDKHEQLAEKLDAITYKDITDGIVAYRLFEIADELRELGGFLNRLADLIDPTCELKIQDGHACCGNCSHRLAGEYEEEEGHWCFRPYCPDCGARVVRDHDDA